MTGCLPQDDQSEDSLRDSFFGMLSLDVIQSLEGLEADDTQSTRRDLIRTMFAAIEGYVWEYRNHVQAVANDIHEISPLMELALSEISYSVTDNGKVEQQVRFVPITSMIRLVTRLAEEFCKDIEPDFSGDGWYSFKQAINIRNRITHPKRTADLEITADDISVSKAGFFWLLRLIHDVMEKSVNASQSYLNEMKSVGEALHAGDPKAWAEYRAAQAREDNSTGQSS